MTANHRLGRRTLLLGAGATAAGLAIPGIAQAAPLIRTGRPVLTHGVQSGDVTSTSGLVWTRADRPSRMLVEVSHDQSFRHARLVRGPVLTQDTDGTGKLRLTGLPPGRRVFYRVRAEDLDGRSARDPGVYRGMRVSLPSLTCITPMQSFGTWDGIGSQKIAAILI